MDTPYVIGEEYNPCKKCTESRCFNSPCQKHNDYILFKLNWLRHKQGLVSDQEWNNMLTNMVDRLRNKRS